MNHRSTEKMAETYRFRVESLRMAGSIVLAVLLLLLVPAASGRLQEAASVPDYPRIAMLWSPAEGPGEKPAKWARYGVIVSDATPDRRERG